MSEDFFEEQLHNSKVKSAIVVGYFFKWASVMKGRAEKGEGKLGYLDFFSGPGKYEDGSDSTPLMILKQAKEDEKLRKMLIASFFDKDPGNVEKLEAELVNLEGIDQLVYKPSVEVVTVGSEVVDILQKIKLVPSLIFIDPFGYKGLSLDFIRSVIKDWGCDCIFFFNYNRINAAITNPFMKNHINVLFGESRAESLRVQVKGMDPTIRETIVMDSLVEALKEIRGDYPIYFKFIQEGSEKTSHFIVFVSKHPLGYHLMKETMAANCDNDFGVPTYVCNPNGKKVVQSEQMLLFPSVTKNAMQLFEESLLNQFSGRSISVEEIYQEHNIGKPYIKSNYKTALLSLEERKIIITNPISGKRQIRNGKLTMGDGVVITFK